MQYIFDHLVAVLIGTVVMLIIFGLQREMKSATVERTKVVMAKDHSIEMGKWIQDDLRNMGSGVPAGSPIVVTTTKDAAGRTTVFEYRRRRDSLSTSPIVNINYSLEKIEDVTYQDTTIALYKLVRKVDGKQEGSSVPLLSDFRIEMFNNVGTEVFTTDSAARLTVSFAMVVPLLNRHEHMKETRWSTSIPISHLN